MSLDSAGNDAKMASRGKISLTDLFNLYPESPCVVVVKVSPFRRSGVKSLYKMGDPFKTLSSKRS